MTVIPESAAPTKWCPFSRATLYVRGDQAADAPLMHIVGHGSNRLSTDDEKLNERIQSALEMSGATRCIGSKCMAWRPNPWEPTHGRCGLVPA